MGSTHGFGKLRRVAPLISPDEVVESSAPVPELESTFLCHVSSVRCFASPGAEHCPGLPCSLKKLSENPRVDFDVWGLARECQESFLSGKCYFSPALGAAARLGQACLSCLVGTNCQQVTGRDKSCCCRKRQF